MPIAVARHLRPVDDGSSHDSAPDYHYTFASMVVVAGTIGGYRHGRDFLGFGAPGLQRVDNSPWFPTTPRDYAPRATLLLQPTPGVPGIPWAPEPIELDWPVGVPRTTRILHIHGDNDPAVASRAGPPQRVAPVYGVTQSDTIGTLVISNSDYGNLVRFGYSEAAVMPADFDAATQSRWDYTVEYGLEQWNDHLLGLIQGTTSIVLPPSIVDPVDQDRYGMGARARWTDPALLATDAPVVFLEMANAGHEWPAFDMRRLILDFFDAVYPVP